MFFFMAAVSDMQMEGSAWFIIVISVVSFVCMSLIKAVIGTIVEFFVIKKRENEDEVKTEVSKFSVIIFILIAGIITLWQRQSIAAFLERSVNEIIFAAILLMCLGFLLAGVIYREPSKNWKQKWKKRRNKSKRSR